MPKLNAPLYSFNRGEVSRRALARVDLEPMRLAAETQENFLPTKLGPMMLRPGTQYIGATRNNLTANFVPFVFSNTDLALLEFTNNVMRVWVVSGDTETLVTRPSVSTTIQNGDFGGSAGWTLVETGTGSSAVISGGVLTLDCPAVAGLAQAKQSVSIAVADRGVEHAIRVTVTRGPVTFRLGTTAGDDNLISEATLDTGVHSLAFTTSAATVFLEVETTTPQAKIVDSIEIESAGVLELPTTFEEADLSGLGYVQSGDIVFMACEGQQQRKIERRSLRSWSYVLFKANDGPFGGVNLTDIEMTPGNLSGNVTLTASRKYFTSSHVGTLFRLFSAGQRVQQTLSAEDTFTDTIRVTGVGSARTFLLSISGTWVGTITLQRSFDGPDTGFADAPSGSYTANGSHSIADELDNSIVWYRIGFKTGDFTSGSALLTLRFAGGGGAGICRVTSYTSKTEVEVEVLSTFSSLEATDNWNEGDWSDRFGWPTAVTIFDGRLWWAGRDRIWGSVSDNYSSFDIDAVGDSAPINRSVGFGPVDRINWLLSLSRLIIGREGSESSVRSSNFDEPLTPTNMTLKDCSTQGSTAILPVRIDARGVFVHQDSRRAYELGFSLDAQDYAPHELTRLHPDVAGDDGFVALGVQRQPDTILHFPRGDGQVATLLHDTEDEVNAWYRATTTGVVESVVVLPGARENRVYYVVARTVGGVTKRYLERMATRDQCTGFPESRCMDSHVVYDGSATTTITGLDHLNGHSVVAWYFDDDDETGRDFQNADGTTKTFTVAGGSITLPSAVSNACVGLPYTAKFKSAKLAYAAQLGTALTQKKKISRLGLILIDTHAKGLTYGQSFDVMDPLPEIEAGATVSATQMWDEFDAPMMTLPGEWDTDARLCLQAASPRPCTVAAAIIDVKTNEA